MSDNTDCPVDNITVNETKVRLVAFFVLLTGALYLFTASWIVAAVLLIDFLLRACNFNTYSPFGIISGQIVKLFKLKNKPVDRAPKRFAAFIGVIFSVAILVTLLIHLTAVSRTIAGVLMVFAALESIFGFCAGCYVYSLLKKFNIVK